MMKLCGLHTAIYMLPSFIDNEEMLGDAAWCKVVLVLC